MTELPSDITGNIRHDHWHKFKMNGRCYERTAFSSSSDYYNDGHCMTDQFSSPPPRPSPMPDYPPNYYLLSK